MEKTVLSHFLTAVPEAAAIWSALLLLALGVLAALVARPERDTPPEVTPDPAAEAAARHADLRRYADEVAVAAAGAAQTARRRREQWLAAQGEADQAWRAYDEAESAARRLTGAAALPAPRTPRTPAEYAARERWLQHAAMVAHWRGDLTARQLADVLAGRNGWDPRRHPAEQEIVLARAVRDHRRAGWRAAAERERRAWRDAELAAEAARALDAEAYAAAQALRPGVVPARPAVPATSRPAPVPAGTAVATGARWRPARVG
ncbi:MULTISPECIES: hypothetical protein [Micromonospora]|uniref:AP2/ERF domain-containing protein n=1 Tax=Micromonospora solifontis TaxID=2487138 RepID=A0ABX9WGC3_9ACTN|nr:MULTISPECIES: hypothetical protein [Micromonospora]NES15523.1 hypothetical protein [Micromonospora sp. PPF5-17B]NES36907.1 hypothetical protein [Micromonospora solifontis]NES55250.1 hypothetical protein [Micromonospora sp. PPF5-6]RNL98981.1 hypothetical protein EFE23_12175 [Micromonospora solifontis]